MFRVICLSPSARSELLHHARWHDWQLACVPAGPYSLLLVVTAAAAVIA